MLEPEAVRIAVQWTARISALVFSVFLATAGLAAMRSASDLAFSSWRRGLLAAFIAAHSVHFATVLTLAAVTGGANIEERGGWVLHLGVAFLFYGLVIKLWRLEQGRSAGFTFWLGNRHFRMLAISLLWLVFVQAYAFRFLQSWLFVTMAVLLIVTLLIFLLPVASSKKR